MKRKLYHAAPHEDLPSIMTHGLLSRVLMGTVEVGTGPCMDDGNDMGFEHVCAADDPDTALVYGSRGRWVSMRAVGLLSFEIDDSELELDTVHVEHPYGPGDTWLVGPWIPPEWLTLVSVERVSLRRAHEIRQRLNDPEPLLPVAVAS